MLRRCVLMLAMCTLVSACFPAIGTHYVPSAETGQVTKVNCALLTPDDAIEFVSGATKIQIEGRGDGLLLRIWVPDGNSIALNSTVLKVRSGGSDEIYDVGEFGVLKAGMELDWVAAGDLLVGGDRLHWFGKEPYIFQAYIAFNKTMGESYKVEMPAFAVNEKTLHVPEITFTGQTGFGIYPVNCA